MRRGAAQAVLVLVAFLAGCARGASAPGAGHVQNWLYACSGSDQTCTQALDVGIPAEWMAAHADWNEVYYDASNDDTASQLIAAGAKHVVVYVDPNISAYCPIPIGYGAAAADFPEDGRNCDGAVARYLAPVDGSYAHAYEHARSGNRLFDRADGFYNGAAMEPFYIGDPGLRSAFRSATLANRFATDVFEDDAGGSYNCIADDDGDCSGTFGAAYTAPPSCSFTGGYWCYKYGETAREWDEAPNPQAAYAHDAAALSDASAHPVIGNNGVATDAYDLQWVRSANVEGVMWENAWPQSSSTQSWVAKANAVLLYHSLHRYVVELSKDESGLFYEIASHWIVYDPAYSVEALAEVNPAARTAGTNDATFPEESVVPADPRIATPSNNDVETFEVSPGVFVREYASCYAGGVGMGYCAAVVNTNASAQPIAGLTQRYARVLVHDASATWAAGGQPLWSSAPSAIPAQSGLILAE